MYMYIYEKDLKQSKDVSSHYFYSTSYLHILAVDEEKKSTNTHTHTYMHAYTHTLAYI